MFLVKQLETTEGGWEMMTYEDQRTWVATHIPEISDVVLNEKSCYQRICSAIKSLPNARRDAIRDGACDWPGLVRSGWAYQWAFDIGDQEYMRQFVTKSQWAYYWAREIGDREYMRKFIAESAQREMP